MTNLTELLLKGYLLAAPAPTPTPDPQTPNPQIDSSGFMSAIATIVLPVIFAVLGVVALGRANKGEVGKVMTTAVVSAVGIVFIIGAPLFFFLGDDILNMFVSTK
jgi:hypothetical protein